MTTPAKPLPEMSSRHWEHLGFDPGELDDVRAEQTDELMTSYFTGMAHLIQFIDDNRSYAEEKALQLLMQADELLRRTDDERRRGDQWYVRHGESLEPVRGPFLSRTAAEHWARAEELADYYIGVAY